MKYTENDQMNTGFRAEYGVVLEASASALTKGHFGIGGEGHFKPYEG